MGCGIWTVVFDGSVRPPIRGDGGRVGWGWLVFSGGTLVNHGSQSVCGFTGIMADDAEWSACTNALLWLSGAKTMANGRKRKGGILRIRGDSDHVCNCLNNPTPTYRLYEWGMCRKIIAGGGWVWNAAKIHRNKNLACHMLANGTDMATIRIKRPSILKLSFISS